MSRRRSETLGCMDGSEADASGRRGGDERWEAFPAESSSPLKARSMMRSATGSGAGVFRGRPRRRFGAALSRGGANRDASDVPSGGCETVAGRRSPEEDGGRKRSRRPATGDEEAARSGARSTTRSILTSSLETGGAWAGSKGGVFSSTGASVATRTGKARGPGTTAASLEAPGCSLTHDASSAYKGKVAIGLMCARVR